MTFAVPVIVALGGGIIYFIPVNSKMSELGKILFFVGSFWLVYALSHASVTIH